MDMHEQIDGFMSYLTAERNYSDKTVVVYDAALVELCGFVRDGYGVSSWQDVTTNMLRDWVVAQMERGSSPATVNKKLSSTRSFYKHLLRNRLVTTDPSRKISGPKKEKQLPSFVRESEMDNLLDRVEFGDDFIGKRDRLIILIFYSTGIRRAELVGLDVESIDFYTNTLKVLGKRNKERIVPFGQELRDALEEYIGLRSQQKGADVSRALFMGPRGGRINAADVGKMVHGYLSQVTTIRRRTPHVLRHSFATAMLNNGAELEVVKQLLGHESIATTEIYTHTTFEELKKAYAKAHPRAEEE